MLFGETACDTSVGKLKKSNAINAVLSYSADVNECNVKNGGCSHKCTNTKGSYICSCPDPELTLAPDGRNCVGKQPNDIILSLKLPQLTQDGIHF